MVQTANENVLAPSPDETRKQRKKRAKREAKAMLAVERANEKVQKAESKVAKAQRKLEVRKARLRTLEEHWSATGELMP